MTGSGTNTYIVHAADEAWVIDPGPAEAAHIANIFKACAGKTISKIFVTHMHPDHSPAHQAIRDKTQAELIGLAPVDDPFQDKTCVPEAHVQHNQVFNLAGQSMLQAVHTPGHVDNHVCYFVMPSEIMITGDHIMQGSTVVIIPPHGNMKAYIASLQNLLNYPIQQLAPGHGEMITQPLDEIDHLITHRLTRETKVLDCLQGLPAVTTSTLVSSVYDDVDQSLHAVAECSLLAHLIKLETEGRVKQYQENEQSLWQLIA
ncbi:MAG: MBL fold metallo-hydrolase [Pseudomonadales bacterium]|nr:MBL fold metallo-hydrolase [Pseudomonadales bacterium]